MYSNEELNRMHKEHWDSVTPDELQALKERTREACEWFDIVGTAMRHSIQTPDSLQKGKDGVVIDDNC